jgi:acetyl esterase/lipase
MFRLLPILIALFTTLTALSAQNPGCGGGRYKDDLFTNVKKTTVLYAPAVDHLGTNIQLTMDVYEPEGDNIARRPVVVLAHGGSFYAGDRTMMAQYCQLLAKKGYVAATIQYRLYPLFVLGFPDSTAIFDTAVKAMGDMKAAVRYFREDAAGANKFRGDADHIFVGGYSAGAVTALNVGFLDARDSIPPFVATLVTANGGLEGSSGTTANKAQTSKVGAVLNLSGGMDRRDWVDDYNVPVASIHGTADQTVPYVKGLSAGIAYLEGSSLLHTRADAVGLRNSLRTVQGAGHTDLYSAPQYAADLAAYWVQATTLLESLTCAVTPAFEPTSPAISWQMTPNPVTNDLITLTLPATVEAVDVQVSDLAGRAIRRVQNVRSGEAIRLEAVMPAVYFVQLTDRAGHRFEVKRIVTE